MVTPNTTHPDPAALPALLERAANELDERARKYDEGLERHQEWMRGVPSPHQRIKDEVSRLRTEIARLRADAAALRAWAPLIVAAVRFTEAQDRIERAKKDRFRSGCAGDGSDWAAAYGEYLAACDDSAAAKEAYRAALAPGVGEGERD